MTKEAIYGKRKTTRKTKNTKLNACKCNVFLRCDVNPSSLNEVQPLPKILLFSRGILRENLLVSWFLLPLSLACPGLSSLKLLHIKCLILCLFEHLQLSAFIVYLLEIDALGLSWLRSLKDLKRLEY
ncbi:hypothetical protein M9H77_17155 [Catharanthus roseus]|uniref:Uncharacterized protein n=1 Tax=Catharanthus roseus TaxID=4058 RepID=A0ACC0B3T2_CATRO|nr:hypothetical protein M9H77_17155 [Catharanthus roseus]